MPFSIFVFSVRYHPMSIFNIPTRTEVISYSLTRGIAPSSLNPGLLTFNPCGVKPQFSSYRTYFEPSTPSIGSGTVESGAGFPLLLYKLFDPFKRLRITGSGSHFMEFRSSSPPSLHLSQFFFDAPSFFTFSPILSDHSSVQLFFHDPRMEWRRDKLAGKRPVPALILR